MSKTPIHCIVGFGGVTPAGRASHNLSHTRVTYSLESKKNKQDYIKSVLSLCNMADEIGESQSFDKYASEREQEVLKNTLVRKIDTIMIYLQMEVVNYLSDLTQRSITHQDNIQKH